MPLKHSSASRALRAKAKNVKEHTIHPALGVPLWWIGSFVGKYWKLKAWALSVIVAFYLPYVLHTHAHYLDNQRCDRVAYAAHVAYQYGCDGRECSPDKEAYEMTVRMLLGSISAGCYAPAPIRPDQAVQIMIDTALGAFESTQDAEMLIPAEDDQQILASVAQ